MSKIFYFRHKIKIPLSVIYVLFVLVTAIAKANRHQAIASSTAAQVSARVPNQVFRPHVLDLEL